MTRHLRFLALTLATGLLAFASPTRHYLGRFNPHPYPPTSPDILYRQAFETVGEVERSGARRNSGPTAGYLDPAVPKAALVDGWFGRGVRGDAPGAGLVIPQDGLVPRDEFTLVTKVRNDSAERYPTAPFPGPQTLLTVGTIGLFRNPAEQLAAVNFATGEVCKLSPDWPPGTWHTVTLWWRAEPPGMELMLDDDHAGRAVAAAPATPWDGRPQSGVDDGLTIAASPAPHPFVLSDVTIYRWWRTHDGHDFRPGPALTIDAATEMGDWSPALGGCLALYEGFLNLPEGPPESLIRDRQFELIFDQAGVRSVRVAALMNMVGVAGEYPDYQYDWAILDSKLDTLLAGRPGLIATLCLDYCPERLRPAGGDHRAMPTDAERFAAIAAAVVGHVKARYADHQLHFAGWNEPDLSHYFTGTLEQAYQLWRVTQRRLMADHPGQPSHWLGTPEYAFLAGHQDFCARLSAEPDELKASVQSIQFHTFRQNLTQIVGDLHALRAAYQAAGVPATVPIQITEHNLHLPQLTENKQPLSWYSTQPNHFTTIYSGAHALALIWESLRADPRVSMTGYSAIGTNLFYWSEPALVTSDERPRPKPSLAVLAMLARLGGRRLAAESNWPNLRALATRDADGTITVIYGSYRPFGGYTDRFRFELDWSGLPERFTWRHQQIDPTCPDDRARLVGSGTEQDLPLAVEIGGLGVGCLEIEPA